MATTEKTETKSLAMRTAETRAAAGRTALAAQKRIVELEKQAAAGLKKAAKATGELAKKHQVAAAGVLVGAGVLAGVAAQRALRHKPTVGEVVMEALSSGASRASKKAGSTARNGIKKVGQTARRVMR